ncbi:hypothetical protein BDZ91DRAFT_128418 [Kalaharituber pfeilii]|nr:hypothetical protein BDZ91DRAFT_128418 [Kalaharituber pfeilii]
MISGNEKMATNTRPLQFSMNFEQMCSYPEIKEMLDSARRFLQNHKPFQPSTPQSLWFEHVLLFQNMAKLCSYLASSRSSPGYLPAEPEFQNPHPVSRNNVTAWMEEGPWNPLTVGSRTAEDTEACSPTIGTATNFPAAVASSTAQNFFSTSDTLNITQPSVPTPPLPPQYCHSTVTTATLRRGEADSLRYTDTMVKTRRPGVAFGSKSLQLPSSQQSPMTPRTSSPLSGIKEHESIDLEHLQGGKMVVPA